MKLLLVTFVTFVTNKKKQNFRVLLLSLLSDNYFFLYIIRVGR